MAHVTRFAPSPTGPLHLGHVYSAFFATANAGQGGRVILRLEDIDPVRCRPGFAAAILEDLAWIGWRWEGAVRRQSEHFACYRAALDRLDGQGLLYPCFCTRAEIAAEHAAIGGAPQGEEGQLYPGTCRRRGAAERADKIAAGAPYALRLDMEKARARAGPLQWRDLDAGLQDARPERFGDVVLARKDTPASYHLCVTVDDALQGVTLVTRGRDLFAASHLHRLLQALLDLPVPLWRHHDLKLDEAGRRYAKRDRGPTLAALREAGVDPAAVRIRAGV